MFWTADVVARVEAALGGPLEERPRVAMVRDVAPNKRMLCVSFRLPAGVALAASPANAYGHAAAHVGAGARSAAAEGAAMPADSHAAAHAGPQTGAADGDAAPSAKLAGGVPAINGEARASVAGGAHAAAYATAVGGNAPHLPAGGGQAPVHACEVGHGGAASGGAALPGLCRPAHAAQSVPSTAQPASIMQEGPGGGNTLGDSACAAAAQPEGNEAEAARERSAGTGAGGRQRELELQGFELRGPVERARPVGGLLGADSGACGGGQREDLSWAGQHGVLHA